MPKSDSNVFLPQKSGRTKNSPLNRSTVNDSCVLARSSVAIYVPTFWLGQCFDWVTSVWQMNLSKSHDKQIWSARKQFFIWILWLDSLLRLKQIYFIRASTCLRNQNLHFYSNKTSFTNISAQIHRQSAKIHFQCLE